VAECCPTCDQRDLIGSRGARLVLWQVPLLLFVAGILLGPAWRTVSWTAALAVAGAACVANAARCGRLHCYFTGPFYLLAALATLTHGLGLLPLGSAGWTWIGAGVAVGSFLFGCVPEWIWGTYARRDRPAGG
jgi:hypothetical protein